MITSWSDLSAENNLAPEFVAQPGSSTVRDKWVEITGDYIPVTIPHWSKALRTVDRKEHSPNVAPKHCTGYRFPDPGMLVFSSARKERNLFNWLLIRDATIHRLMHDILSPPGIPRGFSNELWRMILGVEFTEIDKMAAARRDLSSDKLPSSRSSSHSERRAAAIAIFGKPPDGHNQQEVIWRGHTVAWNTFFKHDTLLVQEILWDVHQYSFQYDLIALDHYLCPGIWARDPISRQRLLAAAVGCDSCFTVIDEPGRSFGMASKNEAERAAAYQSLDEVMKSWPRTSGQQYTSDNIFLYRDAVARRYCQAFVKAFGRPPVLPKQVPERGNMRGALPYKR